MPREFKSGKEPMRNPSRERRKAELVFLRSHVAALERELQGLTWKRLAQLRPLLASSATKAAASEANKRRHAERENAKLRHAVSCHMRLAETLIAAISAQAVDTTMFHPGVGAKAPAGVLHDDFGFRISLLAEQIDRAYRDIGKVFADAFQPTEFTTKMSSQFVDGCNQPVLEGFEGTLVPFGVAQTSAALWQAARVTLWASKEDVESYGSHPDLMVNRVRWRQNALPLTCSIVLRRFMERDRMVVIWRAVTSIATDENYFIEETGWTLVDAVASDNKDRAELSAKRTYIHWTPRSRSGTARPVENFADVVVAVTNTDSARVDDMMESQQAGA